MKGRIKAVFGNMVVAQTDDNIVKNAVGYCVRSDGVKLLCEVIRVRGDSADLQIFEETRGLRVGDEVIFKEEMNLSLTMSLLEYIIILLISDFSYLTEPVFVVIQYAPSSIILISPRTLWPLTNTSLPFTAAQWPLNNKITKTAIKVVFIGTLLPSVNAKYKVNS